KKIKIDTKTDDKGKEKMTEPEDTETNLLDPDISVVKDAKVVLTSWIFLDKAPGLNLTQEYLKECYVNGVGIILPYAHRGCDLVIPIKLVDRTFSFILVQCKLKTDVSLREQFTYAGRKLSPIECFSSRSKDDVCSEDYLEF